jgi:hypothetical protein
MRRQRVLAEPDAQVAIRLKANPGQWYAIAAGDETRRHVLAQVGYRIRRGQQAAFRTPVGRFDAQVRTALSPQPDREPVELWAQYVPQAV